jgi:hypothetical protein
MCGGAGVVPASIAAIKDPAEKARALTRQLEAAHWN